MRTRPARGGQHAVLVAALAILGIVVLVSGTFALRIAAAQAKQAWEQGSYRDSIDPERSSSAANTRSARPQLAETAVQRPRLKPGDHATLRAIYELPNPAEIREIRTILYEGLVLARIERVVAQPGGAVRSEYRVNVPKDAAEGWYAVTTTVEFTGAPTRGGSAEQKETGFYVDKVGAGDAAPRATPGPPSGEQNVTVKLWADQPRYRIGDLLTINFEANRDAFVTLVNVGTSGEVTILFPNRFSGGHSVKAGKTYRVPEAVDSYELRFKGPPGVELVYALATLKPVLFLPTDFPSGGVFHSATERAVGFTRDINAVAKSVPLREQAKATMELEVAR